MDVVLGHGFRLGGIELGLGGPLARWIFTWLWDHLCDNWFPLLFRVPAALTSVGWIAGDILSVLGVR